VIKVEQKKNKEYTRSEKNETLETTKGDLEDNQEGLNAANEAFEALKPQCVDSGVSYEERVKRRREEIQSLQEALQILAGEDLA